MSREWKVGLFVVSTAVLIVLALLYLGMGKGFFETIHTYTLSSKSGDGFSEGMPVVFSGFDIGKVHELELSDSGLVMVKIRVPYRHIKWIKSDSAFILYRPLIGSARLVVTSGNLDSPTLSEDEIPEITIINDINDAIARIEPVLERVIQIAENVEYLTRNLADPKGDLNRILKNAQKITANLAEKNSLLEMAVGDEESIREVHLALRQAGEITRNLNNLLARIDKMADQADQQVFGGDGALPQVNIILKDIAAKLRTLDTTVDNINRISTDASDGMKNFHVLRADIDDAVHSIDRLVKKIESLIGSQKKPEFELP